MKNVIISPHGDDEIIGCFEILKNLNNEIEIVYGEDCEESKYVCYDLPNIKKYYLELYDYTLPPHLLNPSYTFYFPDPFTEKHHDHILWGHYGEKLLRIHNYNVIFYSINMEARYVHKVSNPQEKESWLNKYYKSKSSLWKMDHKYFLFEGYCKWIVKHD
ncbi:MAG: hypothetical protein KatS3mg002_0355 [Candidatus Woesearchaeota archaeon]|nr:MAG: hypothetical protein KatS3mg002_0355 [Candidatus Woesearchaeota archaeon]